MSKKKAGSGKTRTDWHRLFGLFMQDFFTGTPYVVETEKDLSLKKQLLDVVIVRKGKGQVKERLPDGLDDLVRHNLITFKSFREALSDWTLKELTGHYVNYRKQVSPDEEHLLAEREFRLYAVCCRKPDNLAQVLSFQRQSDGVYQVRRGSDVIRVVVAAELPQTEHNAPLHLFSANSKQVAYGAQNYQPHSEQTSRLIHERFRGYQVEGLPMPYTLEDFQRDFDERYLQEMSPEKRRQLLRQLPAEERLEGLPAEERLKGLPAEERLEGITREEIERYLARLSQEEAAKQAGKKSTQDKSKHKS